MSMSVSSRRACLGVVVFGLLVAGCPTGGDSDPAPDVDSGITDEGGNPIKPDASVAPDSTTPPKDGSTPDGDGATLPPPCSRLTTLCKDGEKCAGSPDCVSKVCVAGLCTAAAPGDGVKNGDETDIDCGGTKAPACADGLGCLIKSDCTSGVCTANVCQAPTSTDGVQNGDETGIDCGGTTTMAPRCPTGGGCLTNADCDKAKCDTVAKKCLAPTHSDGIQNLDETGVDCGGPSGGVARCGPGEGCASNSDCNNTACNPGTLLCDPATAADGIKNGTETDVDCGGGAPTNAPGCTPGLTCALDGDCASSACNYAKKCVEARSCKVNRGGDTCGPTGTDSCCASASTGVVTLDKYNITAGRMRAFVTATGGNLRGYISNPANTPAWWNAAWTNFLPNVLDSGGTAADYTGVYQELGPNVHANADGTPFGPANEGCYISGNGARTYRLPDPVNTRMSDPQRYTQAALDDRSLNCVTVYMVAAFCAWDGGRLPTRAEVDSAWGGYYPWGANNATNRPLGYRFAYGTNPNGTLTGSYSPYQAAPDVPPPLPLGNLAWANYNMNYWGGAAMVGTDYSIFVAPPGRFPNGNGPFGHADLGGNVFNSLEINGTSAYWSRSGSWQGHPIPWGPSSTNFAGRNKYWAMGGRCAR